MDYDSNSASTAYACIETKPSYEENTANKVINQDNDFGKCSHK